MAEKTRTWETADTKAVITVWGPVDGIEDLAAIKNALIAVRNAPQRVPDHFHMIALAVVGAKSLEREFATSDAPFDLEQCATRLLETLQDVSADMYYHSNIRRLDVLDVLIMDIETMMRKLRLWNAREEQREKFGF